MRPAVQVMTNGLMDVKYQPMLYVDDHIERQYLANYPDSPRKRYKWLADSAFEAKDDLLADLSRYDRVFTPPVLRDTFDEAMKVARKEARRRLANDWRRT